MMRRALLVLALVAAVACAAKMPAKQKGTAPQSGVQARQAHAKPGKPASKVEVRADNGELQLSPEYLCSVFGGPSCPNNVKDDALANKPCSCPGGHECECVHFYQCDNTTGAYNKDGVGVIDIRQDENDECPHYMQKCCRVDNILHPTLPPPTPTPEPHVEPVEVDVHEPYDPVKPVTEEPEPQEPPPEEPPPSESSHHEGSDTYPKPPTYPETETETCPADEETPEVKPEQSTHGYSEPTPSPGREPVPLSPDPPLHHPVVDEHVCGVRNPEGVGVRITGDEDGEAQFGEFPWMVAILKEVDGDSKMRNLYLCGGALIAPGYVLTAAHCVKDKLATNIKIRAGEWDTQTPNEIYKHQDRKVKKIIIHPDYYGGAVHNDVAILVLHEDVIIGYHISTICLPKQGENFDHQDCFVSGWGKDKFGKEGQYQVILKKLELPVVPHDVCQMKLRKTRLGHRFMLHHSFMCAGGEAGKDTCKGDGGSPLVCPVPGDHSRYQVAGLVAWGIDCGLADVPGVYVNVALFSDWIDETMKKAEEHRLDGSDLI